MELADAAKASAAASGAEGAVSAAAASGLVLGEMSVEDFEKVRCSDAVGPVVSTTVCLSQLLFACLDYCLPVSATVCLSQLLFACLNQHCFLQRPEDLPPGLPAGPLRGAVRHR